MLSQSAWTLLGKTSAIVEVSYGKPCGRVKGDIGHGASSNEVEEVAIAVVRIWRRRKASGPDVILVAQNVIERGVKRV